MQQVHKWLPLLEVVAGTTTVIIAMTVKPASETWVYLGFATLALVPLVHVVVANMHAETLMRELARIKAHDLEDLDKRIEKLHELTKQLKKPEERPPRKNPEAPPSPPVQRSSSLGDIVGKLVELASQVEIAASPSRANSSSTAQPLTGKDE